MLLECLSIIIAFISCQKLEQNLIWSAVIHTDEYEAEVPLYSTQIQELLFSSPHKNLDLQTLKLVTYCTLFLTEHTTNFLILFHLTLRKQGITSL